MKVTLSDAGGDSVSIDPSTGHLTRLMLNGIDVLHRAPWLNEPEIQADESIALVERRLQGDFFCAPFGLSDLIEAPIHGMTANSPWDILEQTASTAAMVLRTEVMGARIEKHIRIDSGALFQTHRLIGGAGGLPVAHHPMIRMELGGRLSFSEKKGALTPEKPLEPNRHWLNYPAESTDLNRFPSVDSTADLGSYPLRAGHEDFIILVERQGQRLGWTAVLREAEEDLIVIAKDPRALPVTMLWYSNGGRDYAPWQGRHIGVLGIEDGRTAGAEGHRAALEGSVLSRLGVETCFHLGAEHVIEHAIYAVPCAAKGEGVVEVFAQAGSLVAELSNGAEVSLGPVPRWVMD